MRSSVTAAALLIPLQIVVGDLHGLNSLQHQPAKLAAMEGRWQTLRGAPMTLFGLPDEAARETRHATEVPKLASLVAWGVLIRIGQNKVQFELRLAGATDRGRVRRSGTPERPFHKPAKR